jgi:TonB family protein
MDGFLLTDGRTPVLPRHDVSMLSIAAAVHAVLFALVIGVGLRPGRVTQAGSAAGSSIGAYISASIAAAAGPAVQPVPRKKPALTTTPAQPKAEQSGASGAQPGTADATQQAAGPIRLGSSTSLNLIRRVEPIYPSIMRSAGMTGQVVLDAVIHADGTIGDVKVLQSTNGAFTQSAVMAVKQWRYAPPGFEAILTVTVNYSLT